MPDQLAGMIAEETNAPKFRALCVSSSSRTQSTAELLRPDAIQLVNHQWAVTYGHRNVLLSSLVTGELFCCTTICFLTKASFNAGKDPSQKTEMPAPVDLPESASSGAKSQNLRRQKRDEHSKL
jgi:hypothetical protein